MDITNKTSRPISVPLPDGKKLFLGPGKTGQISAKSAEHGPLLKIVEAGELELDDTNRQQKGSDGPSGRTGSQSSGPTGNIRRTGDR